MRNTFKNPTNEWRGKPFWAWNGDLDQQELLRQIDIMKEMGLGGFFMHSRTGLITEYLGDNWFDLINTCADYGHQLGMEAWLYDEDRWPSGSAGGKVTRHPEFRQKAILLEIDPVGKSDNVIAEFICDLDGIVCTNVEQAFLPAQQFKEEQTGKSAPRTHLRFSIVEQGKSNFYNGQTYLDTMSREATDAFLRSTHEKYAQQCGDRLGKSITGMFTDEPHRGALLDGFCLFREDGDHCFPYTPKLFEEFQKRFGYDLKEHLPELFLQVDGKRISQVKWHTVELLQQLFIENYAILCREWCNRHNLPLTGHILGENTLSMQTVMGGSAMRYYEHMDVPGIDVLTETNNSYWMVKQLTSVARQLGKKQLLSELYGCCGWQMPFAGHKAVGDWQALLGINLRCHHLSWYTMQGEAKRDYPASILHQSAWHRYYHYIETYFARFGFMMAQGEPACDLLVINPIESVWAQVHLGWSAAQELQDPEIRKIEEQYEQLFHWLIGSQIDFDYGDEEMMSRIGAVEDGVLKVGRASYSTVLIADMKTIRSSTLKLLKQFAAAGGKVVVVGDAPEFVDAAPNFQFPVSSFESVAFSKDAVLSAVPERQAIIDAPDIFGQLRKTEDGLLFAALNINRNERRENVTVRIKTDLPITEWNCETGEVAAVETETSNGWKIFKTDFPKSGTKIWVAGNVDAVFAGVTAWPPRFPMVGKSERGEATASTIINGPFDYELDEPNICVLDSVQYRIDDGPWQDECEILKADQAVRDRFALPRRGGHMLQPWFTAQQPVDKKGCVTLRYSFDIEYMPTQIDLVLEEPENFAVKVNGHPLDISSSTSWIDIAFHRVPIPADFLQSGSNEITLTTVYTGRSNLEAVYLVGSFGVQLNGTCRKLVELPKQLDCSDICKQGLPFYSGIIRYRLPLPKTEAKKRVLQLPGFSAACAVAETNSGEKLIAWDPYEADISDAEDTLTLSLALTRRNTFGPLHDALDPRRVIGPKSFIAEGDEFSESCRLIPSGLLQPPKLFLFE